MTAYASPTNRRAAIALVLFLLACYAAAGLGGVATASAIPDWYETIAKPSWTPPNGVFGPVWSALYTMMAVAGWLVWRRAGWHKGSRALTLFAAQLVLNAVWSWLFFGLHWLGIAFAEVLVLWSAILLTALSFRRFSRAAFWLMVPYLLWVTFAAALNGAIWRLNAVGSP